MVAKKHYGFHSSVVLTLVVMLLLTACNLTPSSEELHRTQSITPIIHVEVDNDELRQEVLDWIIWTQKVESILEDG